MIDGKPLRQAVHVTQQREVGGGPLALWWGTVFVRHRGGLPRPGDAIIAEHSVEEGMVICCMYMLKGQAINEREVHSLGTDWK